MTLFWWLVIVWIGILLLSWLLHSRAIVVMGFAGVLLYLAYGPEKDDCDRRGGILVLAMPELYECVAAAPGWNMVHGEKWD